MNQKELAINALFRYNPTGSRPHICPFCKGEGFMPGITTVKCKTCKGDGVLWD